MRRYNLTANMYNSRYCGEQEAKYVVAFETLNPYSLSSSLILDLGCGTGLLFSHIPQGQRQIIGVDISRELLLLAKHQDTNDASIHVVLADADHLPFRPNLFSCVFAFTVLQNVPSPMETLKEIKKYTKNDANFVFTGLKAVFKLEEFVSFLEAAGYDIASIRGSEALKCHVLTCVQKAIDGKN